MRFCEDPGIAVVSSDVYPTKLTDLLADGRQLPIAGAAVHGVWIQAVLEPDLVAREIHRALVDRGVFYAEAPLMQQVHMGPQDFTRYASSGHRWLFRGFEEISSGITRRPRTAPLWAIRRFFGSLFRSDEAGTSATARARAMGRS